MRLGGEKKVALKAIPTISFVTVVVVIQVAVMWTLEFKLILKNIFIVMVIVIVQGVCGP